MSVSPEVRKYMKKIGRLGGLKGGKSKSPKKLLALKKNAQKAGRPLGSKNKAKAIGPTFS